MFARRFILIGLCLIVGCSMGEPEQDVEQSDRRLSLLTSALDAWQEGTAATLSQRDPPVRFVDDDLMAGCQLTSYDIHEPDAAIEPFADVLVDLTLRDRQGTAIERTVGYQVSLAPGLAVLRSEP
jgi:hypothetical protein